MSAQSRVIPSYDYVRTRWRNGTGWTREIHAEPSGDGGDWDWRLSIAEITADGPFSAFPGIDRELVLLSGEGVRLRFDDGEVADVLPPHGRHRFAGERAIQGELVDGPTHDFNLMWRRDRYDAELWRRPLVGAMVVFAEPGSTWVVHLLAGHARFADKSGLPDLAMGDTAILQAADDRLRHVLDGAGEALLIRLSPLAARGGLCLSLESD
ncbi:HutD family protein [Lysobacter sp. TY2-98]|uniref:HutD/Ves family protein n=1 Tax=Lysobacter sp. TY2-98 TaxID=2290922 RepID=UPI000E204FBF|nr:HutD family protein [Lysobacter sp. TY2-98]AXK71420.1 HutD family protein [Lysobacter sp. TY2-98]